MNSSRHYPLILEADAFALRDLTGMEIRLK
jgi:hypothetical protein